MIFQTVPYSLPKVLAIKVGLAKIEAKRNCSSVRIRCLGSRPEFNADASPVLIPRGQWKNIEGGVTAPQGFKTTGIHAGLKANKMADLSLVYCESGATAVGLFTQNVICAAPVTYCRETLKRDKKIKAIMTNTCQANAVTGKAGYEDSVRCAETLAQALGISAEEVLVMSTGVIGQRLQIDKIIQNIPNLISTIGSGQDADIRTAIAMMTTDLVYKMAALEVIIDGKPVRLGGVCKGSGMICPNMATMLAIVTCDAPVEKTILRQMLTNAVRKSFNMMAVDNDTSTNDTILALASGKVDIPLISNIDSESAKILNDAICALTKGMAKAVASDGEGATCLIQVVVKGAASDNDADKISKAITGSMLVKSAIFGHDPNWGRIACAAGYSGVAFDPQKLMIKIGDTTLMDKGTPLDFQRSVVSSYLKEKCEEHGTVEIFVDLGSGAGESEAWGCDLSYKYVTINAQMTT